MKKWSFTCPARVNLIGEHIDYNGGLVLPTAINLKIQLTIEERTDLIVKLESENMPYTKEFNLNENINYDKKNGWTNYPIGVINLLRNRGFKINKGFNARYTSDIPMESGISSSAAIEVVTAYALCKVFNIDLDKLEIALLCREVENDFIGVKCGIMDQFAVAMANKDTCILLNCSDLKYEYIDLNLKEYKIIITNTNKPRKLIISKYNERLNECNKALQILKDDIKISCLCDLSSEKLFEYRYKFKDETLFKRARHVVSENERVKLAEKYLNQGNLKAFGKLMFKSHMSLKDDFEVTGMELDTIFEEAIKFKGCIGSRMTGAGFGGCNISLVKNESVEKFKKIIYKKYEFKTGLKPEFYVCDIEDGVKEMVD